MPTDAQLLTAYTAASEAAYLARVALFRLQEPLGLSLYTVALFRLQEPLGLSLARSIGLEKCAALTAAYTDYCETRNTARTAEQAYKNRQDANDQHR